MCTVDGCNREKYHDFDECILHCDKPEYFDLGWHEAAGDFKEALAEHIADVICIGSDNSIIYDEDHEFSHQQLKDFFLTLKKSSEFEGSKLHSIHELPKLFEALKSLAPTLKDIVFPAVQSRDEFAFYTPMLEVFGGIEFMGCTIKHGVWFELEKVGVLYFKCKFEGYHSVSTHPPFPVSNSLKTSNDEVERHAEEQDEKRKLPIYIECEFYEDVHITGEFETRKKFVRNVFEDCKFTRKLQIDFCLFVKGVIFNNLHSHIMDSISVENCIFETPFKLNEVKIDSFFSSDNEFRSKFEFKESFVDDFEVQNCNFYKVADFFETQFKSSFLIKKSVFEGVTAFEDTQYFTNASFKHVTFKEFSNFRFAVFNRGLDIEKANFAHPPNFLGVNLDSEGTPRETYRTIKHSFDIVGNHIAANRFFALEMEKNKEDLKRSLDESPNLSDKAHKKAKSDLMIFRFNQFFSDFGQSWQRPFWLIIALAVISQFFYCGLEDVGTHKSTIVTVFCEFSEVTKEFLCNQYAGWFVIWILISSVLAWFYGRIPIILVGSLLLLVLLKIIGISFPISTFLGPLIDLANHTVEQIPPFNKFLVEGHEFISFVINILFAVLIWQLVVSVKRLTKR